MEEWVRVEDELPVMDRETEGVSVDVKVKKEDGTETVAWYYYKKATWYSKSGNVVKNVIAWKNL